MTSTPPPVDVARPWRAVAPEVFAAFATIDRQARRVLDPAILVGVTAAIDAVLGPDPAADGSARASTGPASAGSGSSIDAATVGACVAFAEQFVVDVAGTTDDQRGAMSAAMGAEAFTFVQALYVLDVFRRARIGLSRVFGVPTTTTTTTTTTTATTTMTGAGPDGRGGLAGDDDLWTLLERFMVDVARLDALDPLTSELVRLHGARVHDCRLCRSRRSVRALEAAGGTDLLDDGSDGAGLGEREQAALALTDALVTQPSSIDEALASRVRAALTTEEIVEIVLDVTRNAANKIAVAFGADAPVVTDGVEYYDIDATGEVVADVDIDVVRRATAR